MEKDFDQAEQSSVPKQSPSTEMTFETPEIFAASEDPWPPGQIIVTDSPMEDAAKTS